MLMVLGCGPAEPPRQAAPPGAPAAAAAREKAPEIPGIGRTVVDWQRSLNPPVRVVLGIGGLADGPRDGPLVSYLYPEPGLAESAHYLSRTYASFRTRLANGELAFYGRGRVRPGPVEQRMVVEWARRAAASLAGGKADSYGLALSWHRGASVGNCESVSVFLTGEARAEACAWSGQPVTGRLQPAALSRVYDWFDTLSAFQDSELGLAGEAEPARLVFAGRGTQPATREEAAAIETFAATLLRELSARRRGSAPAPAPTPAATPAASGAPAASEASPLPRLLLPQETGAPALPPLARLAPSVPPPPPPSSPGAVGDAGGTSGRRSPMSQPLR